MAREQSRIRLCVNADDFGLSRGIDRAVLELADRGVVTSTSVMVDAPAFAADAGALAGRGLSVGLHFWLPGGNLRRAVAAQLAAGLGRRPLDDLLREQLDRLAARVGRVTHVDAHQHVHALPVVRDAIRRLAEREGLAWRVPSERPARGSLKGACLRAAFAGEPSGGVAFFGVALMGRRMSVARIEEELAHLAASRRRRALWMVHPGRVSPDHPPWDRMRAAREHELAVLSRAAPLVLERCDLVPLDRLDG